MSIRYGAYVLEAQLGRGGMGEVWQARHDRLHRRAAVKVVRPELLGDGPEARVLRQRFEREAQSTAALRSPHTVEVFDFGTAPDGTLWYAMELLSGFDLKTLVETWGPMPVGRVIHLLRHAASALADAHAQGLLHRDIKPANLVVCPLGPQSDFLKVLDFGLAKPLVTVAESELTSARVVPGSPGYMAPESIVGDEGVDGRADLYALGCVAFWLLTGAPVFERPSVMKVLLAHLNEAPPPLSARVPEVDPKVAALVARLLAKRAEDRFADATALDAALATLAAAHPWTPGEASAWWTEHPAPGLRAADPRIRTSPAELSAARSAVQARLQRGFDESRLVLLEFERRTRAVALADHPDDLAGLADDLPPVAVTALPGQNTEDAALANRWPKGSAGRLAPVDPAVRGPVLEGSVIDASVVPGAGARRALVSVGDGALVPATPAARLLAIFSGVARQGRWRPSRKTYCFALFGGIDLDLTEAVLPPGETHIHITAIFGGADIRVPPGVSVIVEGHGIFGGFDATDSTGAPTEGEASWIRVTGLAFFGGVDVRVPREGKRRRGQNGNHR